MAIYLNDHDGRRDHRGYTMQDVYKDGVLIAKDITYDKALELIETKINPRDEYHEKELGKVYARQSGSKFLVSRETSRLQDKGIL